MLKALGIVLLGIVCSVDIVTAQDPTATPIAAPPPAESGSSPESLSGNLFTPEQRPVSQELVDGLSLPEGFEVTMVAQGLGNARMIAAHENGTIYISRRTEEDVIALFDANFDGVPDVEGFRVVASELPFSHGLAIHENQLFIATDTEIYVADILEAGSLSEPQSIIQDLPDGGQHPNRTLAVGSDGMLYITVGSTCNSCNESNEENATILRAPLDGSSREVYTEGLRNTIGFGWHPETGQLWGMDHGTDWRGDSNPPEELNLLEAGNHYGWPFCLGDQQPDQYLPAEPPGTTKEAFCPTTVPPVLTYTAHAAPIFMVFYTGDQFPEEYQNDAFVAMHGSWNTFPAVGYNVVHIDFDENGQPVENHDFLTGFLTEEGAAQFGRPAGMVVAPDGSLLFTDDTQGILYRISYAAE